MDLCFRCLVAASVVLLSLKNFGALLFFQFSRAKRGIQWFILGLAVSTL